MPPEDDFKGLVKQYIDDSISRRKFLGTLTGIGLSTASAAIVAREFAPSLNVQQTPKQKLIQHG